MGRVCGCSESSYEAHLLRGRREPEPNGTDLTRQQVNFVIPAKAGIHFQGVKIKMDPGFRRDDGFKSAPFEPEPGF